MDDLLAVDAAFIAARRTTEILEALEARLTLAGRITELRQLRGLSAAEIDLLARLEADHQDHAHQTAHAPREVA